MFFRKKRGLNYFIKNFFVVVGIVLVWRGIWYLLDAFDLLFFGQNHFWTALGGLFVGLLMLYLPDKDFKEIEKL
ncbi:MAG: hypothetical protein UT48_C0016G0035 [Parcubacteria group bacterium GW2011_GWE2_39_37]|uniref:Uncharacterized protein n=1 Tax=Candidatus Falkowbacteria bacterium GW2011_GWF2_39_8 TaxID=1618642 RepID=A0A0G0SA95_9BACT|nr:MAG: hypothetical protein UT48_C0016G0035 [Parcubacteria group bacterium GW2011_GWE2_39_37]KKR31670.1 MAG: hypothetical protein UT64_C0054G0013 [Candidatus Falkowbacteria bacterium GW2011_GWF2_39_8]